MRVLLIEDNPGDARLVQEMLKEGGGGFTLTTVERLADGMKFLDSENVDVLLLDLNLPDSNGQETHSAIRNRFPAVPMVVNTSVDDAEFGIQAVRQGADDFLIKGQTSSGQLYKALRFAIERRKREKELQKVNRTLKALSNSSQAMMRAQDETEYLGMICQIVVEDCGYSMVWIGYAEKDQHKTVRPVASAGFEDGYLDALQITWADSERGRGPTGTAIRTGRWCSCRQMLTDPNFAPWREEALQRGYQASIALPLRASDEVLGAITIYSGEPDPFLEDEVKLLEELASDLSAGIMAFRLRASHSAAEEALRQNELRYRSLVELSPVAIFINRNDQIVFANPAMLQLMGAQQRDQICGKTPYEIFHPEYHDLVRERIQRLLEGESLQLIEEKIVRLDGTMRDVEVVASRVHDQHEMAIQVILHDITERKQAEDVLLKAHLELERRVRERTAELENANQEILRLKDQLQAENIYLREEIRGEHGFEQIIGQSEPVKQMLLRVQQIASMSTTVLLLGETGTGKNLIAYAIHNSSPRKHRTLVTVNCAALPGNLIESELFGREKGAFTGSDSRQMGRFEVANGGSIFLDEVGELPLELQAKLLRVIQDGEFERLGSSQTINVDVRIIASTNRNLMEAVRQGRFREDLYYRLNVFPITLSPLRQRKEDIPLLVKHLVSKFSKKAGKQIQVVPQAVLNTLQNYSWPGNVRELENVLERAVINTNGRALELADKMELDAPLFLGANSAKSLEELEREYIEQVLERTHWRISGSQGAASILGMNPSTLRSRMQKLGIERPRINGNL